MYSEEELKQYLSSSFTQEFCISHVFLVELSVNIKVIDQGRD